MAILFLYDYSGIAIIINNKFFNKFVFFYRLMKVDNFVLRNYS